MRYLFALLTAALCGFFALSAAAADYSVTVDYYTDPVPLLKKAQNYTVYAYFGPRNPNQEIHALVLDPKNDNFEIGITPTPDKEKRFDYYWDIPDEKTMDYVTLEVSTFRKNWFLYRISNAQGALIGYLISPTYSLLYLKMEGGKYVIDYFSRPRDYQMRDGYGVWGY
jgi:hypothetical protein